MDHIEIPHIAGKGTIWSEETEGPERFIWYSLYIRRSDSLDFVFETSRKR
jgi:hypothetical protein